MANEKYSPNYESINLTQPETILSEAERLKSWLEASGRWPIKLIKFKDKGPKSVAHIFYGAGGSQYALGLPSDEIEQKKMCSLLFLLHKSCNVPARIFWGGEKEDRFTTKDPQTHAGELQRNLEAYITRARAQQPAAGIDLSQYTPVGDLPPLPGPFPEISGEEMSLGMALVLESDTPALKQPEESEEDKIYSKAKKLVTEASILHQGLEIELIAFMGLIVRQRETIERLEERLKNSAPASEIEARIQKFKEEYTKNYVNLAEYQALKREAAALSRRLLVIKDAVEKEI